MGVYIFTKKEAVLKTFFPKNAKFFPPELSEHTPGDGDISYVDISGFPDTDLKKILAQIKKSCKDAPWGIIDPKGSVNDPASLFFDGACDYLGPDTLKAFGEIGPKRIKDALSWRKEYVCAATAVKEEEKSSNDAESSVPSKTKSKLPPASSFPGWKKMQSGKTMPFYLLYCSLEGKVALDSRLEDKILAQIHQRFITCMDENLQEGDALFWVNSGKDCLFLLPPIAKCAEAAIKSCFKMLVSAPLITMETLNIKIPSNFIFALHYGSISYKPPGKTGTVVSDAVNYIYHLGAKKAEPGRLTISDTVPGGTIPKSLEDCFVFAGEFEDRKIWHSKKFVYTKPW